MRTALVIANRLPFPLEDGWKLRTYHVIRGLAALADTTVVTFHGGEDRTVTEFRASLDYPVEVFTVPPPPSYTLSRLLLGLVTRIPVYAWNQRSAILTRLLHTLGRRNPFDVAVAELTAMYPYLRLLPRATHRVVDTHNIDSAVLRRYARTLPSFLRRRYAALTAYKLERYERDVFADADLTWVCSELEQQLAQHMAPRARVCVVPNGVDTTSMRSIADNGVRPRRLMFCGRMNYHPNVDAVIYFVREILPALKRDEPGVEFWVVGHSPPRELLALAAQEPSIRVTGRVESVRDALATAAVVVVPLRAGGGTRIKILEALAMAKPVVSTSIGMEGLELTHEEDLLVADSPAAFADAIRRLLRDPARAHSMGKRGRATVQTRYEWKRSEEMLQRSLGWTSAESTRGFAP